MALPIAHLAVGIIGLAGFFIVNRSPKKVFISYYSKGDSHYKNLIMAWANNNNFKLNIEDLSTDTKINSNDRVYLKRRMKEQIKKSDYFIVFVGVDTYKREWVLWEIEQAKSFNKNIIAIKEKRTHKSPKSLLGSGATWVYGFSEDGIRKALNT